MTKIFMKLLKQLVKNVPSLIKRKKCHYRVHMVIFGSSFSASLFRNFFKNIVLFILFKDYLSKIS